MNKEMIISSNGHETRVAILEDDQLAELFVEREQNRGVVGNVYKGRVSKVLPGMQSSFVDIGLERDGFLYVSDVIADVDEYDKDDDEAPAAEAAANGGDSPAAPGAPPERRGRGRGRDRDEGKERAPEPKIEELLKEGQDVIVQVAKEPLGTKGARLTCHVTLPGRFLVFMPTVDHIGISRKIDSRDERARLRGIVREFREQHHFSGGVIIRRRLLVGEEDLLDAPLEKPREGEGERQRGIVLAGLDRVHRLSRHVEVCGEFGLRP